MRRYSIWGREHGSDHDVELAQCDSNPEAVRDALKAKRLTGKRSVFEKGSRRYSFAKFTDVRIVENT